MRTFYNLLSTWMIVVVVVKVEGFSISTAEVSDGKEESKPAQIGSTVNMRCSLSMSTGEEWEACQWEHIIEGQFDQTNRKMSIKCTGLQISQGATCTNHGGSHQLDQSAQRIKMDVSTNHCGITLTNVQADDSGAWHCRVSANSQIQYSMVEFFAANRSKVRMAEPDSSLSDAKIILDYKASRPEVRATCRAYWGKPQPTFNWYINDDRRMLNKNDYQATTIRPGIDTYGSHVEETITFSPTYQKLCSDYGLDSVCKTSPFTFNLLCKSEQINYFQRENMDDVAQAIVEVRNSAIHLTQAFLTLFLSCIIAVKIL